MRALKDLNNGAMVAPCQPYPRQQCAPKAPIAFFRYTAFASIIPRPCGFKFDFYLSSAPRHNIRNR